jgi:uncharacterized protein (DUF885 family)
MTTLTRLAIACAAAALTACAATPPVPPPPAAPALAVQDENARANAFFERAFQERVDSSPEFAAQLGLRIRYGEWTPITEAEEQSDLERAKRHLRELETTIDRGQLDAVTGVSYDIFAENQRRAIEAYEWRYHGYVVDQMNGLQSRLPAFLINTHRVESVADAEAYVARLKGTAPRFDETIAWLGESERRGVLPPKFVFPYVVSDARNVIAGAPFDDGADSPLWADFKGKVGALQVDEAQKQALLDAARQALQGSVKPAYEKLIAWSQAAEQRATTDDGVWKLPDGARYYDHLLARYTTTAMTAEQIHALGLAEVARIRGEMQAIMQQVGFKGDLPAFFEFMRTDPRFYYPEGTEGKAAYLAEATRLIDSMRQRLPELFNTLPKAGITVKAVEPFREKSAGKAFYQRPSADGTRPGVYYANLYRMADMPKYEMEALAYHEGIPGHHMQLAIAGEMATLPRFRRYGGFAAYSEGWGLYTERLPKELGLYADPYSDFGRLTMEMTRAVRLVVDTGLHARRWTRAQVIQYHRDNLPMTLDAATKATERYIIMPGQATAYMVGMLKIVALREQARAALGSHFDLRGFHDVLLRSGGVPLSILEQQVGAWIATERRPTG